MGKKENNSHEVDRQERHFCKEGPVKKAKHYCIEPLSRFDLKGILSLIDQEKYFIIHAPRQTGKTSYLRALMDYLNKEGKWRWQ